MNAIVADYVSLCSRAGWPRLVRRVAWPSATGRPLAVPNAGRVYRYTFRLDVNFITNDTLSVQSNV